MTLEDFKESIQLSIMEAYLALSTDEYDEFCDYVRQTLEDGG